MTDPTDRPTRIVGSLGPDRRSHPRIMPVPFVLRLQRTIGNRAVLELLAPPPPASSKEATPPTRGWFSRLTSAIRRLSPSSF